MKNQKNIVNLYDFISQNNNGQKKKQSQIMQVIQQDQKTNGLQTLLYLNSSSLLSSIHSHSKKLEISNIPNKFSQNVSSSKQQIQDLKKRRIQMEKKCKQTIYKNHPKQQSQLSQSLNQSQVYVYKYNQQSCLTSKQKIKKQQTDTFIVYLRQQILATNLQKLIKIIKKISLIKLIIQLKTFEEISNFRKAKSKKLVKKSFQQWRQLIDLFKQRQKIKNMIVNRIKARKFPAVQSYLSLQQS